ncbi:hypothetical protein TRVL_05120 [Trypanosoma vivax]|nr:hypothetical protein TRVL_05120 [Trypanosoma vivax]
MDFFSDQHLLESAFPGHSHAVAHANAEDPTQAKFSAAHAQVVRVNAHTSQSTAADCSVLLPLRGTIGGVARSSFAVHVPSAVLSTMSKNASILIPHATSFPHHGACFEEEITSRGPGAAWPQFGGKILQWSGKTAGPVAKSACPIFQNCVPTSGDPMGNRSKLIGDWNESSPAATSVAAAMEGEAEVAAMREQAYTIQLPSNFVLGLCLPPHVEAALVDHWLQKPQDTAAACATCNSVPTWLSAFSYTSTLRAKLSVASSCPLFSKTPRGNRDEAFAVMVLEGFCITALNIVSQMGFLQSQRMQLQRGVDDASAEVAQQHLMSDGGIFATTQEEHVRRWLRHYLPPEAYSDEDGRDERRERRCKCGEWPSATSVAVFIAMDLARRLLPSLLEGLESTVLVALQPLLETRVMKPAAPLMPNAEVHSSFPQTWDGAVTLLSLTPAPWWWWWKQTDHVKRVGKRSNNSNTNDRRLGNLPCCSNAISASRGYGALRILHLFVLFYSEGDSGEVNSCSEGLEAVRVAHFLISAPVLFSDLLLDREVAYALERMVKKLSSWVNSCAGNCEPTSPNHVSLRIARALLRGFIVLLCWMTYRPGGYSPSCMRKHFGQLLRVTLLIRRQGTQLLAPNETVDLGDDDANEMLLRCVREYFLEARWLLIRFHGLCGSARCDRTQTGGRRKNPWHGLLFGEEAESNCDNPESDPTTVTSHSHNTVCSGVSSRRTTGLLSVQGLRPSSQALDVLPFSSFSLRALRVVTRELRRVLYVLRRDAIAVRDDASVSNCTSGVKRHREAMQDEEASTMSMLKSNGSACQMLSKRLSVSQQLMRSTIEELGTSHYFWHTVSHSSSDMEENIDEQSDTCVVVTSSSSASTFLSDWSADGGTE